MVVRGDVEWCKGIYGVNTTLLELSSSGPGRRQLLSRKGKDTANMGWFAGVLWTEGRIIGERVLGGDGGENNNREGAGSGEDMHAELGSNYIILNITMIKIEFGY